MNPELDSWLDDVLTARRAVLVATDYDGTIAPIVSHHANAEPLPNAFATLTRLANTPGVRVAILTGRGVEDAAQRCRELRSVWVCAEHGSVLLEPGGGIWAHDPVTEPHAIASLVTAAVEMGKSFPGARVETKLGGVALHLREVPSDLRPALVARFRDAASERGARILEGRMVTEARFGKGDKGTALQTLLGRLADTTAVIYAGDDITDESAYEIVCGLPRGFAVHVASTERATPRRSVHSIVDGPEEWVGMLGSMADVLGARNELASTRFPDAT
ncbi:MAG: trehalose-phosphatase [Polyangiales bacterium]